MSEALVAALIGVGGVVLGSALQWFVSRSVVRAESERLHRQLSTEFRLQQFTHWQSQFSAVMAELLAATDPETGVPAQKDKLIPLVLRAQLLLNPQDTAHANVNSLINKLALTVSGWHGKPDLSSVISVHAALIEATRQTLYLPSRPR